VTDGETIGFSDLVYVVSRYETACAGHIFHDDGRLSGDMLPHMARDRASISVEPATGRKTDNDPYGLALVEVVCKYRSGQRESKRRGQS
jgi:hypothetical protein